MKLNLRSAAGMFLVAAILTPALAQQPGADIYPGANIYKEKCTKCHGQDGLSKTFVGKMTHAISLKDPTVVSATDDDLFTVIKSGKKEMPAFAGKLTDDQIKTVLAYVRTLQK